MKNISIGIDFSKETFDATIMLRHEDTYKELCYNKFTNDMSGFKALEKWVKSSLKGVADKKTELLFCGEHTGTCSIGLCDYLAKKQYFMWLESALVIHRKCGIVREKNDKVDSKRIADYALRHYSSDVRPYMLDSKEMKKLKSLFTAHGMLTKDKVAKTNQLKSGVLDDAPLAKKEVERQLKYMEESLYKIDKEIEALLKECDEFSHNYKILNTFKGVGMLTIACLIIKTHNFRYITDPRELGCYAGVVPHNCKSGSSIDRGARTSRYRDKDTNALITSCAMSAIRTNNPIIRPYYDRLVGRGVHRMKALNNCKFKVINVLMAMLRNDTCFSMDIHGKSKEQWKTSA